MKLKVLITTGLIFGAFFTSNLFAFLMLKINMKKKLVKFIFSIILVSLTSTVYAEDVFVKYRGAVNLNGFACHLTSSSFVHRICYLEENDYLVVLLDQTYYHYCRIPANVTRKWLGASSKGRFYGQYIKGNYDCRLGGIPPVS